MHSSKEEQEEIRKHSSVFNAKTQRKTTEWKRLDISSENSHTKGTFHAKMGSIKERNGIDLTEAENIKKKSDKNIQKNCTNKGLTGPDNQNGVPTHIVKHSGA